MGDGGLPAEPGFYLSAALPLSRDAVARRNRMPMLHSAVALAVARQNKRRSNERNEREVPKGTPRFWIADRARRDGAPKEMHTGVSSATHVC